MTDKKPQPQQGKPTSGDQPNSNVQPSNKSNSNDSAPRRWGRRGSGR